ncbi:hypothetical protein [Cupriavidus sp. UGS-1]|uniref:hypothetical protein n=1 Tax=Cupriavidus sp. UGS-1 TaxID=2899826 RepID=UPI001E62D778|nr:hypothetical protein [Cupriavidus sp. UGS-1]MCD9121739.1 hypothetical protein [Cupriavidus sp. UGS-1]
MSRNLTVRTRTALAALAAGLISATAFAQTPMAPSTGTGADTSVGAGAGASVGAGAGAGTMAPAGASTMPTTGPAPGSVPAGMVAVPHGPGVYQLQPKLDPLVERRMARAEARGEYRARKSEARQEYRQEVNAAKQERKAEMREANEEAKRELTTPPAR